MASGQEEKKDLPPKFPEGEKPTLSKLMVNKKVENPPKLIQMVTNLQADQILQEVKAK